MISTTVVMEHGNNIIEIPVLLPHIPPINTSLFINSDQHELDGLFTIHDVMYDTNKHTMVVYVSPYISIKSHTVFKRT